MINKELKAVVLAAGKSKRMKSIRSKVVHEILGKKIINFLLDSLIEAGVDEHNIIIVCGENIEEIRSSVKKEVNYVIQKEQLGTCDALLSAKEFIKDYMGDLIVTVGDNPYINSCELEKLISNHKKKGSECTFISAVFPGVPPPYGRVLRNEKNEVIDVIEEIDATEEQLKIREVNSSIYIFNNRIVFPLLYEIDNKNEKEEYYLTDIIKILKRRNFSVDAVIADDYFVSIGINNRWELQQAQERFNRENLKRLSIENGVTILQPETVYIEYNVNIGRDTIIYPSTYIGSGTKIGKDCKIGPFVYLKNVEIKDNEEVSFEKREG